MAALNCASYCRYAFFPRDIDATIADNPAAIAPAAAAALPPPGVAVGAANCSINGSTPARNPPTTIFPLITAAAVGITGLFVRKPWAEKHDDELLSTGTRTVFDVEAVEAIEEAERLIRGAQQELQRAKAPRMGMDF